MLATVNPEREPTCPTALRAPTPPAAGPADELSPAEWTRRTALLVHDLRNPLLAMLGAASLLRGHPPAGTGAREAQLLDIIQSSGQHLLTMLSQLIDASVTDGGRYPVHARRVPLRPLFEACIADLQPLAMQKALSLVLAVDPALPQTALLDPSRVRQVVTNLLCNAVRFTDAGEVGLELTLGTCPRSGGPTLCVAVRDTGVGLAPHELQALEESLLASSGPAPSRRGGSGLGLPGSLGLLRAMGAGPLRLDSVPGAGTRAAFAIGLR